MSADMRVRDRNTLTMLRVCFFIALRVSALLLWASLFRLLDFQEVVGPDKMSHSKIDDTDLHPFI